MVMYRDVYMLISVGVYSVIIIIYSIIITMFWYIILIIYEVPTTPLLQPLLHSLKSVDQLIKQNTEF